MDVKGFKDTIKWYDQNAKNYANATYVKAPVVLIDHFISLLPDNPRILDAGCGAGRDSGLLTAKGANVTGLDLSKGLLEEARKRNPSINFIYGSFLTIPFEYAFFNGIWAHASLVHLESVADVKKSLKEFKRVLNEKGILHLAVKLQQGTEKTAIVKDELSKHERFFRYYTEKELSNYLSEEGFDILDFAIQSDHLGRKDKELTFFVQKK